MTSLPNQPGDGRKNRRSSMPMSLVLRAPQGRTGHLIRDVQTITGWHEGVISTLESIDLNDPIHAELTFTFHQARGGSRTPVEALMPVVQTLADISRVLYVHYPAFAPRPSAENRVAAAEWLAEHAAAAATADHQQVPA